MRLFKAGDTSKVVLFYLVDSTDGFTEETGLTPSVEVSKNGGAFGAAAGDVAEVGSGVYSLTPASDDVNTLGPIVFRASAAGARPCVVEGRVVAYDPYDAVRLGLAALPNAAADAAGGLPISDAGGLDLDAKLAALDILTGQDGATLATIQPNYAPSVAGSEMALTADAISAIWAKAMSDLAPGAPSATASVLTAINYLYEWFRNKQTMTADTLTIYKDNGVTPLTAAAVSDDGSTTTRGKMGSPA